MAREILVSVLASGSLAVSLWACGAPATTPPKTDPKKCADRVGRYSTLYTEKSGTCGPQNETLGPRDDRAPLAFTPDGGCTGGDTRSADNCEVTEESDCRGTPRDDPLYRIKSTTTYRWNADGTQATGTKVLVVSKYDGFTYCTGNYDIFVNKR